MAKRNEPDDPFADYIEWTQHRYNPGHYLGGNIPPHLRKGSLGPRARRRAGILLGIMAVTALVSIGPFHPEFGWQLLGSIGFVVLLAAAAVRMYFAK